MGQSYTRYAQCLGRIWGLKASLSKTKLVGRFDFLNLIFYSLQSQHKKNLKQSQFVKLICFETSLSYHRLTYRPRFMRLGRTYAERVCTVLLRNNLTLRSRSICVRNASGTRSERVPFAFRTRSERVPNAFQNAFQSVPDETWKRVPIFGEISRSHIGRSRQSDTE